LLECSLNISGDDAERRCTTASIVPETVCCSYSADFKLMAEATNNKEYCDREQVQHEEHLVDPSRGILMPLTKGSGYGAIRM
jgi:hypothetical protein